jgi:RNA polymerase sigma factor (sigma-70 family)
MIMLPDEARLVLKAQQGDTCAFDRLKDCYQQRVIAYCSRLLRCSQDGEQAAQETFLTAWCRLGNYRASGTYIGWLLRIARNTCLNLLRTKKRRADSNSISLDDPDGNSKAIGPEEDAIFRSLTHIYSEQLLQALSYRVTVLAPRWDQLDWDIFALRVGQGEENFAEVARRLDHSVDTVKYRYRNHILPACAAMRREQVLQAAYCERGSLPWNRLDWELARLVYTRSMTDYEDVARLLRRTGVIGNHIDRETLRRRYDHTIRPVIALLEAELGAV